MYTKTPKIIILCQYDRSIGSRNSYNEIYVYGSQTFVELKPQLLLKQFQCVQQLTKIVAQQTNFMIGAFLVFLNFALCQFQPAIEFKYAKARNQKEKLPAVHLPVTWPSKSYRAALCNRPQKKSFRSNGYGCRFFTSRFTSKLEPKASLTPGKAVSGFNFAIKRRMNW